MKYWLIKSEPDVYPWSQMVRDKTTCWDGVRNYQARNHLRAMKKGDLLLYYHSGDERSVVGIAKVVREAYPDPKDTAWTAVDVASVKPMAKPVPLSVIKAEKALQGMVLVKQSRLSVSPVTEKEFEAIAKLGLS